MMSCRSGLVVANRDSPADAVTAQGYERVAPTPANWTTAVTHNRSTVPT